MTRTRLITLLIAVAMLISVTACGGTPAPAQTTAAPAATTAAPAATTAATTTGAAEEDPMTISVALWDIALAFEDDSIDPMKQYFYDKFNVVIEPMGVTWGDAGERYQIWSSSDSMPDISGALDIIGGGRYFQWIEDGVIRALPSNLTAYPMVNQFVNLPESLAYQVDGNNYFLPRITYEDVSWWAMDRGVYFRRDWMENLGISEPKSTEEFIEMMVAFTFNDPDGNGENDTFGLTRSEIQIYSQNFANFGYHERFWQKVDGRWVQPDKEAIVIPLIDMGRRIYKAGALDPDYITHTSTTPGDTLFSSGRAGAILKQNTPGAVNTLRNLWMEYHTDLEFLDCVDFLPLWDTGLDTYRFSERAFWSETYIGSQVDDEKMDRILNIADWMYTDEGMMFFLYGFEDVDYKIGADGEVEIPLPLLDNGVIQPLAQKYPFSRIASLICWAGSRLQYENVRTPKVVREFTAAERDFRIANWKDPMVSWNVAGLNVPEKQETTYDSGQLWNMIMMDTSDTSTEELYETMMKPELEGGGYYRMLDAVNKAAEERGW